MSDTNALRARIASEANRPLTDDFGNSGETFATAVNREINNAITHYAATRFTWNEVQPPSEFTTTVSGTRNYSLPSTFTMIDTLKLIYTGNYITLGKRSFSEIDGMDTKVTAATGVPSVYCIYGNTIRLFPAPNGAYTLVASGIRSPMPTSLTGSYTAVATVYPHSLTVTSTASHNSRRDGWTMAGAALISARARAAIQINYLNNERAITEMAMLAQTGQQYLSVRERQAHQMVLGAMVSLESDGRIKGYTL